MNLMRLTLLLLTVACALAGDAVTVEVRAQAPATAPAPVPAPIAQTAAPRQGTGEIRARIAEIEADTALDEAVRASIVDLYRRALELLEAEEQERERTRALAELVVAGPTQIEKLREEISALGSEPLPGQAPGPAAGTEPGAAPGAAPSPADTAPVNLEQRHMAAQTELGAMRSAAAELERRIREEEERPSVARNERAAADAALSKVAQALSQPLPVNETQALYDARMAVLSARERRRQAEISRIDQELLTHDMRMELLRLERERATTSLRLAEENAAAVERRLNSQRRVEAASAQAAAERRQEEAAAINPILGEAASVNAELTRERQKVASELQRLAVQRERTTTQTARIEADAESTRKRVGLAGVSSVLGRYLRDQRTRLGNLRSYEREAALRQDAIAQLSLRQIALSEDIRALSRPEQVAYQLYIAGSHTDSNGVGRAKILEELRVILVERRSIAEDLSNAYSDTLRALSEVDFEEQRLAGIASDYARYLDERLLWIPSAQAIDGDTVADLPGALGWLFSPGSWQAAALELANQARHNIPATLGIAALLAAAIGLRGRMRRRIGEIEKLISRAQTDRFVHTLEAIGLTLLAALVVPIVIGAAGRALYGAAAAPEFSRAIGAGAIDAALVLGAGLLLLRLCDPHGVAAAHFRWPNQVLGLIRRHIGWWLAVTTPLVFVIATFDWQSNPAFNDSLGRLVFLVQSGALAAFAYVMLSPTRGLPARYVLQYRDGWISRLRGLWFPGALLYPLALAILAAAGFYFTAISLADRLVATAAVLLAAILGYNLLVRWLTVTRRRLEYEQARERRIAEAQRLGSSAPAADAIVPEEAPDLASLNQQTLHLLKVTAWSAALVGVLLVWSGILPALTVLSEVELWRYSGEIDGETASVPVTLESILIVLFVGALITVAARNLPAALEIAVLQRLPIDPGLRYAIKTVSQYLIVGIGFIVILSDLGVGWSNVQFLVAALGVGLGFGLQEVVANFVCGIIILFERPMRIGDTVTVGDSTGKVTRVRIRATTLRDVDNREIVVPNKTFITERVINWTLTDSVTRVVIPIGIAYGSDVERAKRVILDSISGNELIMPDPPMRLLFRGLGDNSLNLELYVHVRAMGDRLDATDHLLEMIYAALNTAGIGIPFPQRDIHLGDIDRIEAALRGGRPARAPDTPGTPDTKE